MAGIVILADDLTGACDTGVKLAHLGYDSKVLATADGIGKITPQSDVCYTLNTDSRGMTAQAAYQTLKQTALSLKTLDGIRCYKKIDSVLRGNIGSELDALLEVLAYEFSIIAPSLPDNGRTLKSGVLHVANNGARYDLFAVDAVSATTRNKCCGVDIKQVRAGAPALVKTLDGLAADGNKLMVVDAETEDDLAVIAAAVNHFGSRVLPSGSAGLANHLFDRNTGDQPLIGLVSTEEHRPVITVIGTRHPSTVAQVQQLKNADDSAFVIFDTEQLTRQSPQDIARQITSTIPKADRIVVTTQKIYDGKAYDGNKVLCADISDDNIVETVTQTAATLIRSMDIRAVIASGGDTAGRLIQKLGAVQLRLLAEPIAGVATGVLPMEEGGDILIATKSGGFGEHDTLAVLADYMAAATVVQNDKVQQ